MHTYNVAIFNRSKEQALASSSWAAHGRSTRRVDAEGRTVKPTLLSPIFITFRFAPPDSFFLFSKWLRNCLRADQIPGTGGQFRLGIPRLPRTRLSSASALELLNPVTCIYTMADNAHHPRPPPNRRRDKVQLSCDPCRHRKYVPNCHHKLHSRARLTLPG